MNSRACASLRRLWDFVTIVPPSVGSSHRLSAALLEVATAAGFPKQAPLTRQSFLGSTDPAQMQRAPAAQRPNPAPRADQDFLSVHRDQPTREPLLRRRLSRRKSVRPKTDSA